MFESNVSRFLLGPPNSEALLDHLTTCCACDAPTQAMYACARSNNLLSSMDNDIPFISLNCIALITAFPP